MQFANLIKKLIDHMFGTEHPIVVTEVQNEIVNKKKQVCVYVITGEEYFGKIIGKKGKIINILNNLLKIKSYLKMCRAELKIEK